MFWIWKHSKKILKCIGIRNIVANINRTQAYDTVMCGYIWNRCIDFMLNSKILGDFTNSFFPNNIKKNAEIKLNIFNNLIIEWKKKYWLVADKKGVKEVIKNIY